MHAVTRDLESSNGRRAPVRPNRFPAGSALIALLGLVFLALAAPAQAAPSTTVTLTFDDGRPSQVAAAQELASRDMKATFYISTGLVGLPGVMTLTDLNALKAEGMEISAHTVLHRDLAALSSGEAMRELCLSRNWLMDRGFDIYDMAYPYDSTSASVKQLAAACGYNSARSGGQLQCNPSHACAETTPPLDAYALRTPNDFNMSTTLAQMKAAVTNAENNGGGWVPLELHDVCDGAGDPLLPAGAQCAAPYYVTRSLYRQFLDWLRREIDAGRVQVKTVHEVIGGPLQPKVAVDPAPVRTGNLLLNPSFEEAGTPADCWANISNGSGSPPIIATTSDAHEGAKALAITLPAGYDSWAYNLIAPVLDLAQCSPTASAGRHYTFTGWYKGDGQIKVVAYWRNADNQWARISWGASGMATFPAAAAWTKATFGFRAPAGATGVSSGFYVDGAVVNRSAGNRYTIDDTSLIDDTPSTSALAVNAAGTGSGVVTSSPSGIACGSTCQADFAYGSSVTVAAVAASGSRFTGWSGACAGTVATCTLAMDSDAAVTAVFAANPKLSLRKEGTGTGAVSSTPTGIDCGADCAAQDVAYTPGTTLTLTATPTGDSTFTGWSDGLCGGAPTCTFSLNAARTVTATFTADLPAPPSTNGDAENVRVAITAQPAQPPAAPAAVAAVPGLNARPALHTAPKIRGQARLGRLLECTLGIWNGRPTRFIRSWRRNGKVVGHGATYRVAKADRGQSIRCRVTARNAQGASMASSAARGIQR